MSKSNLPYKTKHLFIDKTNWEYISTGSRKKTFLILPGGGQNAQSNWKLIKEFEKDFKVVAITIYDCKSINELFKAVTKILQEEKVNGSIVLYGLSIGALMAQSFADRNKKLIDKLIISHGCTPQSRLYKSKIILPLTLLRLVLPIVPNILIKLSLKLSGVIQGQNKKTHNWLNDDTEASKTNENVYKDFKTRHWNKTILKTWINLHRDFFKNERFDENTFSDWNGKVLILHTDNDPFMQDGGWFRKTYPKAKIQTFIGTGHLTYYYQFEKMIEVMRRFLYNRFELRSLSPATDFGFRIYSEWEWGLIWWTSYIF